VRRLRGGGTAGSFFAGGESWPRRAQAGQQEAQMPRAKCFGSTKHADDASPDIENTFVRAREAIVCEVSRRAPLSMEARWEGECEDARPKEEKAKIL